MTIVTCGICPEHLCPPILNVCPNTDLRVGEKKGGGGHFLKNGNSPLFLQMVMNSDRQAS